MNLDHINFLLEICCSVMVLTVTAMGVYYKQLSDKMNKEDFAEYTKDHKDEHFKLENKIEKSLLRLEDKINPKLDKLEENSIELNKTISEIKGGVNSLVSLINIVKKD